MVVSNESLALLYNETDSTKSKEKLFLEIKNNVKENTQKLIRYRVNRFSWKNSKIDDFENYFQIADEILLNTIIIVPNVNKSFNLEKWYLERLKNSLWDIHRDRMSKEDFDIKMDFQDETCDSLIFKNYNEEIDLDIDNKYLHDIMLVYIDKIKFRKEKKKEHKEMFLKSMGFTENKESISFEDLAKQYNCTRQNVNNICKRCIKKLADLLEKDNKLELFRQYL